MYLKANQKAHKPHLRTTFICKREFKIRIVRAWRLDANWRKTFARTCSNAYMYACMYIRCIFHCNVAAKQLEPFAFSSIFPHKSSLDIYINAVWVSQLFISQCCMINCWNNNNNNNNTWSSFSSFYRFHPSFKEKKKKKKEKIKSVSATWIEKHGW